MPLPLTVSCSSKIQIGFTFLVPAYPGYPGKEAVKWLLLLLLNRTIVKRLAMAEWLKSPNCNQDVAGFSPNATIIVATCFYDH